MTLLAKIAEPYVAYPLFSSREAAREQIVSLCAMWESVCVENGWLAHHQTAYPNAINVLSDPFAWSSHLRQQVSLMCQMWEHVCSTQGWRPDALPAYAEAQVFLHMAIPSAVH